MNIPNFLTLLRIVLVPVLVIFLINMAFLKALILFACLGLTDALDGFLARILNQQTVLGSYLDPIADKVLITSCFLALAILKVIPGWLAVVVISRDVIILLGISVLSIMNITFKVQPLFVSKVTTTLQIAAVFFALFFKAFPLLTIDSAWLLLLYWSTAVFTVLSGYRYVVKGVKLINST
ncbi:MAG: CDP-alcohol phosphatidyltransferase family protein [Syntrophales bacterium]|nr:CDP-alcohol phosphatidyltransferase family protein [Syntrophales bacterium]PKN05639.1 MAG: CDP-diacylglycerol--glycerol-3-phosphate 3-phosphatidyltransferase [Deltaproteobacteria bacterium HGW-Deltaproteobacteria-9]